jgi:hypothetical protein
MKNSLITGGPKKEIFCFLMHTEKASFMKPRNCFFVATKNRFLGNKKIAFFHGALKKQFLGNRKNRFFVAP